MPLPKSSALENALGRIDAMDTTDLALLVRRLARERRLLESVFQTVREGVLVIHADGTIAYANTAGARMIGLDVKQLGSARLWKLIPELAHSLELTSEGHYRGNSPLTREMQLTYPEDRYVRLYLMPMNLQDEPGSEEGGDEVLYSLILSDVTEERVTTEERIENERIQSILQLAGGVAHELGNPLNSLNIHLQLMKRQIGKQQATPKSEKLLRSLEVCGNEVERLHQIITHFLEAVRPKPPNLARLDVVAVLEEVLEIMGAELTDAGVRVDVELPTDPPYIQGDRDQLKQVFFNILKNAREALGQDGEIRIRAESDAANVFVYIADNGKGIPEDVLSHVFEPYFTTKQTGTGLGMMIVHRILRAHGGQIGIDSREGRGTVVTLEFPREHRRIRMLDQAAHDVGSNQRR